MAERRFIKISEASILYSLHPKTVAGLVRARRLPHVRLPSLHGSRGQVRIDRVLVDEMLEKGEVLPAEKPSLDRRKS